MVTEVEDAFAIGRQDQVAAVWRFHHGLDNWVVQARHQILVEHLNPAEPALRLTHEASMTLVFKALIRAALHHPDFKRLIRAHSQAGRRLRVKDNGHFAMTAPFASRLFRDHTDSEIIKHQVIVRGLAWGGYHYRRLTPPA
ncbi:hypothetical protein [Thiocystis violacea]|uniref:hypothetical protein n=1 Tax=Thiocystis violacea TaxID=13725 RepID=UPI00190605C7|nr:hypothetical protein [Thiocystis violacea]MBK1719174.1 hypothetical protein [Thiocystis violacea]